MPLSQYAAQYGGHAHSGYLMGSGFWEGRAASATVERVLAQGERRPDIQGLRAIAVTAVLLFHVDEALVPGGYLGVDAFFVLSGFLITHIIYHDIIHGQASLVGFYRRRLRRLFPASAVTAGVTVLVGALLFASDDFRRLGASAISAVLIFSNVLFWSESGYFDAETDTKPLLHTWSLSAEEQFYLLWPALLLIFVRLGRPRAFVLVSGVVSLIAAQWLLARAPSAVFFLTPFRVFEFAAGAAVCFLPRIGNRKAIEACFIIGMAALLASLALLDPAYPMPGAISLLPVAAVVLCLIGGSAASAAPLRTAPVQFIGDISYSLYLVHWPIIVFYTYATGSDLTILEMAMLTAGSVIGGYVLYFTVENRLRSARFWEKGQWRKYAATGVWVGIVMLATHVVVSGGWRWRVSDEIVAATSNVEALRSERDNFFAAYPRTEAPAGKRVLVIGDSHSRDLLIGLYANGATYAERQSLAYRCQPAFGPRPIEEGSPSRVVQSMAESQACEADFEAILNDDSFRTADVVIISPRWKPWAVERLDETLATLKERTSATIVVFGPTVEYEPHLPRVVEQYGRRMDVDAFVAGYRTQTPFELAPKVRAAVEAAGLLYVDKMDLLCDGAGTTCPAFAPGTNTLVIWDYGHLTVAGANYMVSRLKSEYPDIARLIFD